MKNNELKDIIAFAIDNEVDAYEFYNNASIKINDKSLKQTFEELAEEELKHKKFLEDFLAKEATEMHIGEVIDYKISETVDKPKLSTDMNFADAIGIAMKNEEESMDMYKSLANICLDEEQKKVFVELAKMEQMHKARLEEIYTNAAYAEVW